MIEIKNNKTIENKEIKKDEKNTSQSILSFIKEQKNRIKNQLIDGIKRYYKLIILITITIFLIFWVYKINPSTKNLYKSIGGADPASTPAKSSTPASTPAKSTTPASTPAKSSTPASTPAKSSTPGKTSGPKGCLDGPFDGTINNMYKVLDYTFFIYLVLIMLIVIPSVPILLYMAVIYFILTNLFSILKKV